MSAFEKRKATQWVYCRGCDKKIVKDEEMLYRRSYAAGSVYLCLKCAVEIGRLADPDFLDNLVTYICEGDDDLALDLVLKKRGDDV